MQLSRKQCSSNHLWWRTPLMGKSPPTHICLYQFSKKSLKIKENFLSSDSTDIKSLCPTMTVPRYLLFISNLISFQSITDSWQVNRSARMLLLGKDYIFYFFLFLVERLKRNTQYASDESPHRKLKVFCK